MVEKRPPPDGDRGEIDSKRLKSTTNPSIAEAVARAKARAQALAAKHSKSTTSVAAPQQDVAAQSGPGLAQIQARLAALKKSKQEEKPSTPSPPPPPPQGAPGLSALQAKLAALRSKTQTPASNDRAPARPSTTYGGPAPAAEPEVQVRGGLAIGLHPALLGDANGDTGTRKSHSMAPKFATSMGNRRIDSPLPGAGNKKLLDLSGPNMEEIKQNPYYDPSLSTLAGRERIARSLVFNPKGKYVAQANKLKAQARLEEIKQELANAARKAGVDENTERGFLVSEPPDVEWWDEGLLEEKTYDCIDNPAKIKIHADDSIITSYVQHPVLLKPPQEQRLIPIKPMYLTSKEQAKLRRMRRAAELKEKQAKIRLGLEPPPPPKVKRGNMMRVMGEQAIADPTAVEMLVENQIRERAEAHERANEERKLTKEERRAKLAQQQEIDAQKGLHMCVFKINNLAYGKHRYQVDINAKQNVLTGVTILNPKVNLVVVEGGWHSITTYKKLMLNRIKWTENGAPKGVTEGNREAEAKWLQSVDDEGNLKDLSFNKCELIFEGEIKDRVFRKWSSKICETDADAREYLSRTKLDSLWALARGTD